MTNTDRAAALVARAERAAAAVEAGTMLEKHARLALRDAAEATYFIPALRLRSVAVARRLNAR